MSDTINCPACRGRREVIIGMCSGCGGDVEKLREQKRAAVKVVCCPQCGAKADKRGTIKTLSDASLFCTRCRAHFEALEYSFSAADPERNAEKNEAWERRKKSMVPSRPK